MRFHQPVGVIQQNNDYINSNVNANKPESRFLINSKTNNQLSRSNLANITENLNLTQLQTIVIEKRGENINNFDTKTFNYNKTTTLESILQFKSNNQYFKNYLDSHHTKDKNNIDLENGNNGFIFIESLNFTEENLSQFTTSSPTTPAYDYSVTNQSFNQQNCLSSYQKHRRENLIKLDLESNYMTKHEGPMQVGDNSAGCSVESSPVDSLLDDQEILSPSSSSCADLSSPDPNDLQKYRHYPRGIINPNYPGFQHLAHTLAEHFIDHHQFEQSSDSEISEDFDFDVAYRSGNLGNVNIMSDINDSNNNNDNINNNGADGPDKNIDLNRNKNGRSILSTLENAANDFGVAMGIEKEYEDGNDNLLLKSEPKVFCESKQLGLHVAHFERFLSDDEDEECCNVSTIAASAVNSFKAEIDSNRMDFDDDEMADLSGEDDAAIKNELENIDKADNDFNENINCDLASYLQQYDFKLDLKKSYEYESEKVEEEECLTDEDNSKLPTPDILIEHNREKLQNSEEMIKEENSIAQDTEHQQLCSATAVVDISLASDESRDYQPDLIKNITDTINTNDNNQQCDEKEMRMRQNGEGDNEVSSPVEHEIPKTNNEKKTDDDDERKIINQVQTELPDTSEIEVAFAQKTLPLSFESTSSATVDIIGDFGKEIEKEIGLIVSGYRNATNEKCSDERVSSAKKAQQTIRPTMRLQQQKPSTSSEFEVVLDENKFIEHLKYFSKMGDAVLSSVEETIVVKSPLVDRSESTEQDPDESLIPTAIVKPKYQKLSFDERQLPVCGATSEQSWYDTTSGSSSTTITTTPRKVQKHLPKSQKSFAKHTRKLVNKSGEICVEYDMSDKEANSLRHREKDIDYCVAQNSVAIVQPLKKVIDVTASVNMNDEKSQKPIDSSKNNLTLSHKHEQKARNSSKTNATNELAPKMSDNSVNIANRKASSVARDCEKKVPTTKKKDQRDNSDIFDVYNIETALPVIDLDAIESHLMAAKEEEQKEVRNMMRECDLDDNDPLSEFLRKNLMVSASNASSSSPTMSSMGKTETEAEQRRDKKVDSISDVVRQRAQNINHSEIDTENDKVKETERKNDREEIRRRLAMGEEDDYFSDLAASRPVRKPNLQSRLQNGMNLQICFMNEAASDSESSDSETCPKLSQGMSRKKNLQKSSNLMSHRNASLNNNPYHSRPLSVTKSVMDRSEKAERPTTLSLGPPTDPNDNNFFTHQARLQIEARSALAQAKDMAHMQMEIERQKQGKCPITKLVHQTLEKIGVQVPPSKRRLSRQMLTNMNIAQLQIIINDFHSYIETLNEVLVKYLMDRDDLSMRQDSMLIDIEDITRYLAEKEEAHLNIINKNTPKQQTDSKPAFTKVATRQTLAPAVQPIVTTTRQMPKIFTPQNFSNKKSLVVNGNGHSMVKTSISRDKIQQHGLHL